jgi:NADH-quinone oxidoreductase subunit N
MDSIILKSFLPEIFLSLCILLQLIFNARLINNLAYNFPILDKEMFIQSFFILLCLLILFLNSKIEGFFNNFLLLNDAGGNLLKSFLIVNCLFTLNFIARGMIIQKLNFFEFLILFLLSVLALLLLVSSYDFISAYIILEMQALSLYVLASFKRDSAFSSEAGLKYFIFGSFISGLFLFGCSLLYGALGTLNFNSLNLLLSFPLENNFFNIKCIVLIGILLIFVTFFFKVSAAPFHFWAPDVYEGSPLGSTVIFSIIPKIIIFNFLIKCVNAFSSIIFEFQDLFIFIGFLSVFIGTFFAIRQKRLKRLLIYSSISQIGFLISALATNTIEGFSAIYFFLFIYIITSIITWGYITQIYFSQKEVSLFEKKQITSIFLSQLSNFFKLDKVAAFSFILIFFSMAGIPPLSGFLSKFFILSSLINSNFIFGSCVLIFISAVSAFYYLRIVKIIFFETKKLKTNSKNIQTVFPNFLYDFSSCILAICSFSLILFFFNPEILCLGFDYLLLNSFGF